MPKCDFNKVVRTPFPKNTCGGLLLNFYLDMAMGGLEIPLKREVSQKRRVTFARGSTEGYRNMRNDPILELSLQRFTK